MLVYLWNPLASDPAAAVWDLVRTPLVGVTILDRMSDGSVEAAITRLPAVGPPIDETVWSIGRKVVLMPPGPALPKTVVS